MQAYQNNDKN